MPVTPVNPGIVGSNREKEPDNEYPTAIDAFPGAGRGAGGDREATGGSGSVGPTDSGGVGPLFDTGALGRARRGRHQHAGPGRGATPQHVWHGPAGWPRTPVGPASLS